MLKSSIKISPLSKSNVLKRIFINEVFPDPVDPIIPKEFPASRQKFIFFKAFIPESSYLKDKLLTFILPEIIFEILSFCMISFFCFKNSLILFCEASACCTTELIHPNDATGHVNIFT